MVETLPQLESNPIEQQEQTEPQAQQSFNIPSNIEQLLDERCVATKLYLQHDLTLSQLASDSGYRSYSTFSLAFKQRMGQSLTAWMHNAAD